MTAEYGWLSLLPPLTAVVLALWMRHVFAALAAAITVAALVLSHGSIAESAERIAALFFDLLTTPWILKTLVFVVLVGSVMELMRRSGGVEGFVHLLQERLALVRSRRSALLLVYVTGLVIFIESSITSLVAGAVGRPLASRFRFSREKLAYVCDSTSAPVCSLLLLNGWGALLLGLIAVQVSAGHLEGDAVALLIGSVAYNFYAMIALVVTFVVIWFDWDIGAMKTAPIVAERIDTASGDGQAADMLVPLALMVGGVFFFLWLTGEGNLLKGSGSSSVCCAMLLTLAATAVQYVVAGKMTFSAWWHGAADGARALLPMAAILLLAFAIGRMIGEVGTGAYLASFLDGATQVAWLAAAVFAVAAVMAFSTGTSWGTFSVMLPVAVTMGAAVDANAALLIGAVVSGGVFGDHCSPISDTTIIASLAAGCDHTSHVRTQLPYALLAGGIALAMFALAGWRLSG